jgi:hypothetical protein
VSDGYAKSIGWPDAMAESPKKSIATPTPYWPDTTASGTPKLRSVIAPMLPT